MLTGEGADEVFGGYDIFKEAKVRRFCARAAGLELRPLLLRAALSLPAGAAGASRSTTCEAFFARRARRGAAIRCSRTCRASARTAGAKLFFSGELREQLGGYDALDELRDRPAADFARWHPLSQAQYLETALSAARLHPVVAGRPRGDGARGRGPLPVPRPSRGRVRGAHPAAAEAPRPAREAHPARSVQRPAARRRSRSRPSSPTARRTASPSSAPARRPMSTSCCRRTAIAAAGYFDAARGREARRQVPRAAASSASATTWPSSASSRRSSGIAHSSQARDAVAARASPHRSAA